VLLQAAGTSMISATSEHQQRSRMPDWFNLVGARFDFIEKRTLKLHNNVLQSKL
jgi:hypothetical protein